MRRARIPAFVLLLILIGAVAAYGYETRPRALSDGFERAMFGEVPLNLEFAATPAARERGLSGRTSVPDKYGMLFSFPKDDYYGFWMKDTLIPLDMFWLDSKGHVIYYLKEVATSTYPDVFYPTVPARFVLETRAGFAQEYGIATGTALVLKNLPIVSQ